MRHPECREATAYEKYDLADGDYWLERGRIGDEYERQYIAVIRYTLERFPQLKAI